MRWPDALDRLGRPLLKRRWAVPPHSRLTWEHQIEPRFHMGLPGIDDFALPVGAFAAHFRDPETWAGVGGITNARKPAFRVGHGLPQPNAWGSGTPWGCWALAAGARKAPAPSRPSGPHVEGTVRAQPEASITPG